VAVALLGDALVVVVHGHRQRGLGAVLPDHMAVEVLLDLRGGGQGGRGGGSGHGGGALSLLREDLGAHPDAFVADVHRGPGDELADLAGVLAAEGAARPAGRTRGAVHAGTAFFLRLPGWNTWSTTP